MPIPHLTATALAAAVAAEDCAVVERVVPPPSGVGQRASRYDLNSVCAYCKGRRYRTATSPSQTTPTRLREVPSMVLASG